jgi:hypothetical protein
MKLAFICTLDITEEMRSKEITHIHQNNKYKYSMERLKGVVRKHLFPILKDNSQREKSPPLIYTFLL